MKPDTLKCDICIIGAGAGGLSIAAGAAQLGADVILIEKHKMGGDCLNTGCVPSKALLSAAKAAQNMRTPGIFGIMAVSPEVDFFAIKDHVFDVIAQIAPHDSVERFEGLGVRVLQNEAWFTSPATIQAGETTVTAKYFVIATGSTATVPPIPGLDGVPYLTNETIFDLREKPDHLIIIGGGPIGCEMAQAHRRLGSDVSVIDIGAILPKDDTELAAGLRETLTAEGVSLFENTEIQKIDSANGDIAATLKTEAGTINLAGSHLLIATGRKPVTDGLDLEAAGIQTEKGFIKTDRRLRTSNKKVFAVGDCTGGPMFTHVAGYHAGIVIRNILFRIPAKTDYAALPWVTYTDPELAQVGLTEDAARKIYGDKITVTRWPVADNDRARAERKTDGLLKVIAKKNGKILGASLLAANAGELVQVWGLAISQGLKMKHLAGMIAPYPTVGEINKRAAGEFYTPKLYSNFTRTLVRLLLKLG